MINIVLTIEFCSLNDSLKKNLSFSKRTNIKCIIQSHAAHAKDFSTKLYFLTFLRKMLVAVLLTSTHNIRLVKK